MRTKEELPECPVATAVSLIGGKWKLLILRNLKERPWRFNELKRSIDGISQKVLTDSLRQMIDDGLAREIRAIQLASRPCRARRKSAFPLTGRAGKRLSRAIFSPAAWGTGIPCAL